MKPAKVTQRLLRELRQKVAIGQKLQRARERVEARLRRLAEPEGLGPLPAAAQVMKQLHSLDASIATDPARGRQLVASIYKDVRISVVPQPSGIFLSRDALVPAMWADDEDEEPTEVMERVAE